MPSEQLQGIIEFMRTQRSASDGVSVTEQRARIDQFPLLFAPPGEARFEPVDAGGVPAEWVTTTAPTGGGGAGEARAGPRPVLLYFHGGGYTIGSPRSHRNVVARLALAAEMPALSVGYRLAPEHPFPAALDDACTAYRWLRSQGRPPGHIVVSGDSAGGGLAVALLVALRDADDPLPAAAALLSPWTDLATTGESITTRAALDPVLTRGPGIPEGARSYLAGVDAHHPLASPLYADLTGLPPLLVQVGDWEVLLDDSVRLAERARAVGVEVELEVVPEAIHGFQLFAGGVPEADDAVAKVAAWLRERVG